MTSNARALKPEEYFIQQEPYYEPVSDEIEVFEAVYQNNLPVLLKGSNGCGKTMLHGAYGVAAQAAIDYRLLSR